jgi:hypothetical protein
LLNFDEHSQVGGLSIAQLGFGFDSGGELLLNFDELKPKGGLSVALAPVVIKAPLGFVSVAAGLGRQREGEPEEGDGGEK